MDLSNRLESLLELAEQLGMDVRCEQMGGDGGGLCKLRGQYVLFVDLTADLATRYDCVITALAGVKDLDQHYLPPEIREDLEKHRRSGPAE
jgi:hypothetical protein